MPDASTKTYSLSEIAQIVGVDEKQLHVYAHKGLIPPISSTGSPMRYTAVDCARLKIIKRALQLGYEPDNIFNLIGHPGEVLAVVDPFSACRKFAMAKYKQIYDELSHCEPLDQLNKQCDLRLITTYIKYLKEINNNGPQNIQPQKAASQTKPRPAAKSDQALSETPKKASTASPTVQSYSVSKLWDYMEKGEQQHKKAPSGFQRHGPGLQKQPPLKANGDGALTGAPKQFSLPKSSGRRSLGANFGAVHVERLRKSFTKPVCTVCIGAGILILMLTITGYFLLSSYTEPAQEHLAADRPGSESAQDAKVGGREATTQLGPSPDLNASGEQRAAEPAQPTEKRSAGSPLKNDPDQTASSGPGPVAGRMEPLADMQSAPTAADVEQPKAPVPPVESQTSDSKPAPLRVPDPAPLRVPKPAPLRVQGMRVLHDALNNIYRAEFTILKSDAENDDELVSGYVFVHLESGDEAADPKGLLLPPGELQAGKPTLIQKGARFSIRYSKQIRVTAVSSLPPSEVTSGRVLAYSSGGDLLFEQSFNVPPQPFFAAPEKPPAQAPSPPDDPIAPGSTPTAAPEPSKPQATESQAQSTPPATNDPEAGPAVKTEAGPVTDAPRLVPEEIQRPAEEVQPIARIQKTGDPEAAIWEQKSYDAAVNGDFDQAIVAAARAIELDPGRINPYINRSWAYIEKGMLAQAIKDSTTALSIDSQNAFAYNNRGLAYQRNAQMYKARDDYGRACELGLDLGCRNLDALTNQARIADLIDQSQRAFKAQDWDGVIRTTTQVISLDPQNTVAFTNRSAAYAQKNFLNKALKDSNDAISSNPDFSLAYNNRGYVFELLGNNKKASADYLKSCSLGLDLGCKNHERLNRAQ